MHFVPNSVALALFVTAVGCAGSTPSAKSTDGGATTDSDGSMLRTECSIVQEKFTKVDEAVQSTKGKTDRRTLVPALQKMAGEFKAAPMKTPELNEATTELIAAVDTFSTQMKELEPVFDEIAKVDPQLVKWWQEVEAAAGEFDEACAKVSEAECKDVSARIEVPHLDGGNYARHADDIEAFVKTTSELKIASPGLKKGLDSLLSALGHGLGPLRQMGELNGKVVKISEPTVQLKAKFNKVREVCGMPVRK